MSDTHQDELDEILGKLWRNGFSSGYKGVQPYRGGFWAASISVDNHKIHLGHFKDVENAVLIRLAAEEVLWN